MDIYGIYGEEEWNKEKVGVLTQNHEWVVEGDWSKGGEFQDIKPETARIKGLD